MGMGYGNAPLMNALQGVLMNGPGMYPGGCSQGFGPGYGQYGPGYGQYYGHRNDYADAYRDVGIANAVVDLFGNLAVMSMQNSPRYAVPVSAYPAAPVVAYPPAPAAMYAPPPAVAIPTTPGGHYETQQVVITPGRYEDIKVLVPESIDPSTGVRTGGYYEMRHRWIREVTEYRPVWVTP